MCLSISQCRISWSNKPLQHNKAQFHLTKSCKRSFKEMHLCFKTILHLGLETRPWFCCLLQKIGETWDWSHNPWSTRWLVSPLRYRGWSLIKMFNYIKNSGVQWEIQFSKKSSSPHLELFFFVFFPKFYCLDASQVHNTP